MFPCTRSSGLFPAARVREFNTHMVDFYRHKNATRMMAFLTDSHPDAADLMTDQMRAALDA